MAEAMSINVSTGELRGAAESIRKRNTTLKTHLENIKDRIIRLNWKSEASTEIMKNITAMQANFDEYEKVVESYAQFLVDAATKYEQVEEVATSNASAFRK